MGELRDFHPLRHRQVREVEHRVHVEPREVDVDELGQVLRQAVDLDLVAQVRDHTTLLDARRTRCALEVQGNRDAYLLVLEHALQVDVQYRVLRRMSLHVLQDGGL